MRKVKISPEVSGRCSGVCLGLLQGTVRVEESCTALRQELLNVCAHLHDRCKLEDIVKIPEIEDTRACYRAVGKDAHRYRGSAEAMMRRAVREKGLYFINNVVEVNNIISLKSAFCLGTYDTAHLHGTLTLARAPEGAVYQGIGKEEFHIEFLPVLTDDAGPFGNPSSDSVRAMITEKTQEILLVIYSFSGRAGVMGYLEQADRLLTRYCAGGRFERAVME